MTEAEIRKMDNVSPEDAAKFIGKTVDFIRCGLQYQTLPFGCAVKMPGGRYSYSISPGLLIAYKNGTLPVTIINKIMEVS